MKRFLLAAAALGAAFWVFAAPQVDLGILHKGGEIPTIAVPDLRGVADAQGLMPAFNQTLWSDISGSGVVKMASKSYYPKFIPQQPADFTAPAPAPAPQPARRGRPAPAIETPTNGGGHWLTDWSGPPVSANYLAFGYTATQNGVLVLYGWLYDLSRGTPANAQVIGKRYLGSVNELGARKIAHEFAADILAVFGQKSLFGTKIVFVSDRTGHKEIWM